MRETLSHIRKKTRFISIFMVIFWCLIVLRLFSIQIQNSGTYRNYSLNMSHKQKEIKAQRGIITDRKGRGLAINVKRYSIGVHPKEITDKNELALILSKYLNVKPTDLINKFNTSKNFVFIDRDISSATADSIKKHIPCLKALELEENIRRQYPYNDLAGQTLGFTSVDNIGIEGLEKFFDDKLSGEAGFQTFFMTGTGQYETRPNLPCREPENGNNITLTLDIEYQNILHEEIVAAHKKTQADKAMGILMDPNTGDILAMASSPTIDPNNYQNYPAENRKNIPLTDVFEPGSTFKIFTAAAALEESIIFPEDTIETHQGFIIIQTEKIRDHETLPDMSFADVIRHSSNVGTIRIAQKLGTPTLYHYVRKFGFDTKTGILLPGEVQGIMKDIDGWTPLRSAQISMGQGIACTALQLVCGYAAVANGGILLKPQIVRSISEPKGNIVFTGRTQKLRRVISEETARTLRGLLLNTVEAGTGFKAKVNGMDIAGKTGTSQKTTPEGGYSRKDYIASFVGFFPADKPKLLCAVIVDNPRGGSYYGSSVSAPVVKNVFKRIVNLSEDFFFEETSEIQYAESPHSGTPRLFINKNIDDFNGTFTMPDLKGMSAAKVIQLCNSRGLKPILEGSGKVIEQEPRKGKIVNTGELCKVKLSTEG
ncbi:MAG: transpeptidase family protein [Candidatus Marinimicrobia bacterium]|nr:transpeptidase family protein [Candidatus Neomarinimicrobiota bacterium]